MTTDAKEKAPIAHLIKYGYQRPTGSEGPEKLQEILQFNDDLEGLCMNEYAALQAAQVISLDDARKVLPSAEWWFDVAASTWHKANDGPWFTIEQAMAGIALCRAMQGASPEAVALREEYAG